MMDETGRRDVGRLAMACGAVAIGSAACLAAEFAVHGPFGTLNDIGNAAIGLLSAALAVRLRQHAGSLATHEAGLAIAGAAVTVAGSALVVSGATGWFLAGLASTVGFAGIGAWLVVVNRRTGPIPSRGLRRLGTVAGLLMVTGLAAIPAIVLGVDDPETAPGWAWLGFIGWLGIYALYPAWAIWLATAERHVAGGAPSSRHVLGTEGPEAA